MIYVYCFSISLLFAYLASRSKNKGVSYLCSAISILVPCILGGLRQVHIGGDTALYGRPTAMKALAAPSLIAFLEDPDRMEFGFKILTYIVMKIFGHENWCYFVFQLITVGGIYIGAYKHRKTISLPLTLLMWMLNCYNMSYNILRQCIGASIVFMNLDQLEKKQYKKFAVTIFIAYSFHYSAAMLFVILLGMHWAVTSEALNRNFWIKSILLYGAIASMFLVRPMLFSLLRLNIESINRYADLINGDYEGAMGRTAVLIFLGEVIMTFLYRKKGELVFADNNGCMKNMEFYRYNAIFIVAYSQVVRLMTGRTLIYSTTVNVLLLAAIPAFVKEKYLRFLVAAVLVTYYVLHWWYACIYLGLAGTWPYESILDDMLL